MAKKQQDMGLEIFANLRTIMAFVVFGTAIVSFVEYHSSSSAEETYNRWDVAIKEKEEQGSYLSLTEFKSMISGYPTSAKIKPKIVEVPKDDEKGKKNIKKTKSGQTKNAKINSEKASDETDPVSETDSKKVSAANIIYTWKGPFTKSFVTVQMKHNTEEGEEEDKNKDEQTYIYRISPIQH